MQQARKGAIAPAFLTARDAAAFIGVSERKFHELRRFGLVPEPVQLGDRTLRWHRQELVNHILLRAPRGGQAEPARLAASRR